MRSSGILMHITSLPSPYGIGSLGKCAYEFVDFLKESGQKYWQILPLSPTGYGDSPYQALSTFAGNHYLIDLEELIREGLLTREETEGYDWGGNPEKVDFGVLFSCRLELLKKAYERFAPTEEYHRFLEKNRDWLEDYGLFMALKKKASYASWQYWPEPVRMRQKEAIARSREQLKEEIHFHWFLQYEFFTQWQKLRAYAHKNGISIIGDVPIYVPLDSTDVWADPQEFDLDEQGNPVEVAGVPPDAFTADGQLWGNPLYRWENMEKTGYRWWIRRLKAASHMYDVVRLDHFRGFESYWAVPAGNKTAAAGHWKQGPGKSFISAVRKALPELRCIAEDLGYVTPQVRELQEFSGYPGMKVLEFAFDSREHGNYLPHYYPVNSVCYGGTHDNMTLRQWFHETPEEDVRFAEKYLGLNDREGRVQGMIRGCMGSVSRLCVIQMQDYLELDGSARMNLPGSLGSHNWSWRVKPGTLTGKLSRHIRELTRMYGRM